VRHRFHQLDVFTNRPLRGNPLAVVHDASAIDTDSMARFARWTNLSETTFLLPPTDPAADYRVRIFTPFQELPFAGHPTLGSCHAWLLAGGQPRDAGLVVQQCGVGLVRLRRSDGRLAFAAPPLRRSGPLDPAELQRITTALGLPPTAVVDHQLLDNGPAWRAVLLASADAVRALRPDFSRFGDLEIGVIGPEPAGHETQFEVRGFAPGAGVPEDPVTGSLNAGLAQWLIACHRAPSRYVVAQGTLLGRAGRVHVERDGDDIWIGGDVAGCIEGTVTLGP
jgi:PhzF family phenazine biosynthesis protein